MNALPAPDPDTAVTLNLARDTLMLEAQAITDMASRLNGDFVAAVRLALQCQGRLVVMGIGKSGHIGRKLAATLASTGSPAIFVHPTEASHGDLGMITQADQVLAISNSGESEELTAVLPAIKRMGIPIVAMTGRLQSSLARHANVVLDTSVSKEACPHNLAPTASTTAQLAMGDALAMALLHARNFRADDFARSHPGGSLGRRLLLLVTDVMRPSTAAPKVTADADLSTIMREMSNKGLGATAIVNSAGQPIGIFTDGDLRRLIESGIDLRAVNAAQVMHVAPHCIAPSALAVEAVQIMETHRINSLLVVDNNGVLCGALNNHDLMRAKVI